MWEYKITVGDNKKEADKITFEELEKYVCRDAKKVWRRGARRWDIKKQIKWLLKS